MRKLSSFTSLIILISILVLPHATAASAKAGAPCTKAGATAVVAGMKFTCVKSGKKLLWNKGVAIVKPTPTPTPSATPTPTPSATPTPTPSATPSAPPTKVSFKAPIPITLPVPQTGLITFSNILDHIAEIPAISYQRVQDVVAANAPVTVPNSVYIGPTTTLYVNGGVPRIQQILAKEQQLWKGFLQPSFYAMYIYNAADEPVTEQKFTADFMAKGYNFKSAEYLNGPIRAMAGNCSQQLSPGKFTGPLTECRGANSGGYVDSSDAYLHLGQSANSANDPNTSDGVVIAHEYNHAVQGAQWIDNPLCRDPSGSGAASVCNRNAMANQGFSACWIFEGLPTAVGSAVAETSFASYMNFRKGLPYGWGPTTITDYTQSSLRDYLFNQSAPSCYQNGPLYNLGYSVGTLTTEALIAIGGPQSVMAIFSMGAEGKDFATAFQSVYGISWSEGSTILSKVLAAEYATYGPPPK
jgi:hypothetical protein